MKTNVKTCLPIIVKSFVLVLLASILGVAFMAMVYALPRERMVDHVRESEATLRSLNDDANIAKENYLSVYDTNTNIIMLHEAIMPVVESSFSDALLNPTPNYLAYFAGDWVFGLMEHVENRTVSREDLLTYPRYWHGYLVLLKPLLLFFDLLEIYQFNTILQCLLVFVVFYLMIKKLPRYAPAFVLLVIVLNPVYIACSFQLSSVYYAILLTILLLLLCSDSPKRGALFVYIFVFNGIFVAFFDFLTYPLAAFAIPAVVAVLLQTDENGWTEFVQLIKNGIAFLWGYAGMWVSKWVWASLFTDENVILDGIMSVLHRTGTVDENVDDFFNIEMGAVSSIVRNARSFFTYPQIILIILALFVVLIYAVYIGRRVKTSNGRLRIQTMIPIGLLAASPIAWYVVVSNHCALHPHLECREWSVCVFAVFVLLSSLIPNINKQENKDVS